jgi:hypothetical protein
MPNLFSSCVHCRCPVLGVSSPQSTFFLSRTSASLIVLQTAIITVEGFNVHSNIRAVRIISPDCCLAALSRWNNVAAKNSDWQHWALLCWNLPHLLKPDLCSTLWLRLSMSLLDLQSNKYWATAFVNIPLLLIGECCPSPQWFVIQVEVDPTGAGCYARSTFHLAWLCHTDIELGAPLIQGQCTVFFWLDWEFQILPPPNIKFHAENVLWTTLPTDLFQYLTALLFL